MRQDRLPSGIMGVSGFTDYVRLGEKVVPKIDRRRLKRRIMANVRNQTQTLSVPSNGIIAPKGAHELSVKLARALIRRPIDSRAVWTYYTNNGELWRHLLPDAGLLVQESAKVVTRSLQDAMRTWAEAYNLQGPITFKVCGDKVYYVASNQYGVITVEGGLERHDKRATQKASTQA